METNKPNFQNLPGPRTECGKAIRAALDKALGVDREHPTFTGREAVPEGPKHNNFREALMRAWVSGWYAGCRDETTDTGKLKAAAELAEIFPAEDATDALIAACTEDWNELWKFFNWFASGESQKEYQRAEPLAVLGELYQRLAIIDSRRREALKKAGEIKAEV